MSLQEREHCARYPHWALLSWVERLAFAQKRMTGLPLSEVAARYQDRNMSDLEWSVAGVDL